jgi:hypothetical protein
VAGAGDAGSAASSSELELGANLNEPAPAASAAAPAASASCGDAGVGCGPPGAVEGGSAARGTSGRGGAGVVVVDWTLALAQESKSESPAAARRCAWREMAASSDSRRGRCQCIRPRTPARPVKGDRSADDMRPKMAQNLPPPRRDGLPAQARPGRVGLEVTAAGPSVRPSADGCRPGGHQLVRGAVGRSRSCTCSRGDSDPVTIRALGPDLSVFGVPTEAPELESPVRPHGFLPRIFHSCSKRFIFAIKWAASQFYISINFWFLDISFIQVH